MIAKGQYTITELNDGVGVSSVDVQYYKSTSSSSLTGGSWSTTSPTWEDGKYIWSKTVTTYTNGTTKETNPVCITGAKGSTGTAGSTGTGITSITEEYYLSTSKTTQSGGSWVTTPPVWSTGMYMWTRSKIVYKNPTSTAYTTPVCDSSWEAVNELEEKVDTKAEIWFYEGAPTLSTEPVSSWDIEEYEIHVGDLYYDTSTGYAYRFKLDSGVYSWEQVQDKDTIEALAIANSAQDTADNKRRVFLAPPLPPYDNGDLWINDGEIYVCQITKSATEEYAEGDFIIAVNYTDDTLAIQNGEELTVLKGTVQTIKESTDEFKISFDTTIKTIQNETKETTEALETMSYSFGTKELKIANSDDPVNATFNNRGVKVYTYKDLNTIMNEKGLGTNKLIVVGEAQIGNLKITKATDENGKPCTDFHHLISTIQDITDLE